MSDVADDVNVESEVGRIVVPDGITIVRDTHFGEIISSSVLGTISENSDLTAAISLSGEHDTYKAKAGTLVITNLVHGIHSGETTLKVFAVIGGLLGLTSDLAGLTVGTSGSLSSISSGVGAEA